MCCLKYEHPLYAEFAREVPAVGVARQRADGEEGVVAHQVPADAVVVRMKRHRRRQPAAAGSVCGSRRSRTRAAARWSSHPVGSRA